MAGSSSIKAVPGPPARSSASILAAMARSPLDAYLTLAARYGDTIRVPIGPRNSVFMLWRPEHAEHVLAANQDNYVKAFTYRPLRALIGNGLLTSEGDDWRRHRRLVQPIFARRDVMAFGPAMTAGTQRMLASWAALPDGTVVDVFARMSALALDIAGRALFDTDLSGDAAQIGRALSAGQRVAVLATFLPLPWGPKTNRAVKTATRWLGRTPEGIEGPVGRIIGQRRGASQADAVRPGVAPDPGGRNPRGSGPGRGGDLLDVLLAARPDGAPLADAEVADEVATFLLAGHETSANALSWSLALLSAYPAAREQLELEVDTVLSGREPEAADAEKLPYTTAVIAESMRLYPPAWTIERDALADDEVAGVPVPAGSLVAVPPYLVHRHPEFWPDPAGFAPARFVTASGTAASPGGDPRTPAGGHGLPAQRHRYSYIPFGGGRRACVGQSFAELETVLVLASIAQRYRLELTARGIPKPTAAITLRPGKGGLPMRLLRRA